LTDENSTEIKVFGNDDESLKTLGQLLSSETSRKIIHLLTREEMYTNQISMKLGIQMNTTVFHLKKLVEVGLVTVTHKKIVKKGVDHKYYKMVPNMFVTSTQSKKEVHENGFLKKFFKDGIKFASIGILTFSVFMITDFKRFLYPNEFALDFPVLVIPLTVLIIGLIIERILSRKKKGEINPISLRI